MCQEKKGLIKHGVISSFKCFGEGEKEKTKEVTIAFGNLKIVNDLDRNCFCEVAGTEP